VQGVSENIHVFSIVDRYLEHARICYFENAGEPEVFLSSADWMTRNLTRRVELMCPVFDKNIRSILIHILQLKLRDNVKSRQLQSNGTYTKVPHSDVAVRSQFEAAQIETWKTYS
jgi:polyphosphate kinase